MNTAGEEKSEAVFVDPDFHQDDVSGQATGSSLLLSRRRRAAIPRPA